MTTAQPSSFGLLLRRYRLAAALTQEELAERARLSVRGIASLERGDRRAPHRRTIEQLADALNLPREERSSFTRAARSIGGAAWAAPNRQFLGASSSSFVGRGPELALLQRHLEEAGPPVLLLAGEPGMGKTRLLQEAQRGAAESGWTVLQGGCQRRGQDPFTPLVEALSRHLQWLAPAPRRAALEGCGWLICLLPELTGLVQSPVPLGTLPAQQEHRLLFAAVTRYLQNVAGSAGTLLILDDLQWAGADALDLLASLVMAGGTSPLRVVAAYRHTDVGADNPLTGVVADLARGDLVRQLPLGSLEPAEAEQLLRLQLPGGDEAMQPILERAGGVPFFLVSYAKSLAGRPAGEEAAPELPWSAAQVIRQRVAALPQLAREALGVAAIIGRVVPRDLLSALMAQPEEEVLSVLDAACQAGLLAGEGEHAYRFTHDTIREAVEADLGLGRRMTLHRRIGQTLEAKTEEPPVELMAYHYSRGGCDDKAVQYLELAGDRARAQYACATAAGYYRDLVERLVRLGQRGESARAYEKLGETLHVSGRYDEALEALEEAAKGYLLGRDQDGEARAAAQIGQVCHRQGRLNEGIARLSEVVARLERPNEGLNPPRNLWRVWMALSANYHYSCKYEEAVETAERAVKLARAAADTGALAETEMARGASLLMAQSPGQALPVLEEAARLGEEAGALEAVRVASYFAAMAYLAQGRMKRSQACGERALAAAEPVGDPGWIAVTSSELGFCLFQQGEWAGAQVYLERGAAMAGQLGPSFISSWAPAYLGQFYLGIGAWDDAARLLNEALRMAEALGWVALLWYVQSCLAELDILRGRSDVAVGRLEPALDGPTVDWRSAVMLPTTLAWAYLAGNDVARADEVVHQAESHAARRQHLIQTVGALRIQGMVLSRQGCWETAEARFQEALALASGMPHAYGKARILVEYGMLARQRWEPDSARRQLEEALGVFQRLGARKDVERTEQSLRVLASGGQGPEP